MNKNVIIQAIIGGKNLNDLQEKFRILAISKKEIFLVIPRY